MRAWLLALLAMTVPLTGCAFEGDGPWAPERLTVESATIQSGELMPQQHACDGDDRSPPLSVGDLPPATETIAVVMVDRTSDAPTVGWVVWNIPPGPGYVDIPEDQVPQAASMGENSEGDTAYAGPCPPSGQEHTYRFTVYAVDRSIPLDQGASWEALEDRLGGHAIAKGHISAPYTR